MTHLVIDSTVLDALIAAGELQSSALNNLGCRCEHNVAYAGMKTPQVVTKQCVRCKSRREWAAAKAKAEAVRKAAA